MVITKLLKVAWTYLTFLNLFSVNVSHIIYKSHWCSWLSRMCFFRCINSNVARADIRANVVMTLKQFLCQSQRSWWCFSVCDRLLKWWHLQKMLNWRVIIAQIYLHLSGKYLQSPLPITILLAEEKWKWKGQLEISDPLKDSKLRFRHLLATETAPPPPPPPRRHQARPA